jgi:hypothetical protein
MTDPIQTPESRMEAQLKELDRTFHDWLSRSRNTPGSPESDVKVALRAHALFRSAFTTLKKSELQRPGPTGASPTSASEDSP